MDTVPRGGPDGSVKAFSDYINQRQSADALPLPSGRMRLHHAQPEADVSGSCSFSAKQCLLPSDGRSEWKIKNLESSPEAWEINPALKQEGPEGQRGGIVAVT